jgi:hypothetical protein
MRALLYGLVLLHAGPGIAFALVAFGCEGGNPFLGAACAKGVFFFALLTAATWLVMGLAMAAAYLVQLARNAEGPRAGVRAWALLALTGAGAALGASGVWLTGSDAWWVAVPTAVALGWVFLANPLVCEAQRRI